MVADLCKSGKRDAEVWTGLGGTGAAHWVARGDETVVAKAACFGSSDDL